MFNRIKQILGINNSKKVKGQSELPLITAEVHYRKTPATTSARPPETVRYTRNLLKEATSLKKEKKYKEACEKLREAYVAEGAEDLTMQERLRLPMYLQLAGKSDEGWKIMNEMNIAYTDIASQAEIANQMRVFLDKEKNYQQALLFSQWTNCLDIQRSRHYIEELINSQKRYREEMNRVGLTDLVKEECKSEKEDPVLQKRIEEKMSLDFIQDSLNKYLKKLKKTDILEGMSRAMQDYLKSNECYQFHEIRNIITKYLNQ